MIGDWTWTHHECVSRSASAMAFFLSFFLERNKDIDVFLDDATHISKLKIDVLIRLISYSL